MKAENDEYFRVVSLSGGKDSTAMLLLMLERNMPVDLVIWADTTMEFPEMYEHISKLDEHLYRERGLHITALRHPRGFEWMMFDVSDGIGKKSLDYRLEQNISLTGRGWPNMRNRWCTGFLKAHLINKFSNTLKGEHKVLHYIGIAADEAHRCKNGQYPLVEWGITEAQALEICYDRGFDFGGLYRIYHRVSCWCCPLQRVDELRKLRRHHPRLWEHLLDMDERAKAMYGTSVLGEFKRNWSVARYDKRFAQEGAQMDMEGGF